MSFSEVVILSAVRTPVGDFSGGLSKVPAHQLGAAVIGAALERAKVPKEDVSEVIMGQVLTAGQGMNPARQASVSAGLPYSVPAMNVAMVCGSGLKSILLGKQSIECGTSRVVVAGGQESMSRSQHSAHLRDGVKFGEIGMADTMLKDGLTDAFHNFHMGITAEKVAEKYLVSRSDQDDLACASQRKAAAAAESGAFAEEIVPVSVPGRKPGQETVVERDLHPKPGTTKEGLAKLRPAFKPDGGTVTAGNASGLNDGAAAVVLCSAAEATARGVEPLCTVVSSAVVGCEPEIMGVAPVKAVREALDKAGWSVSEVDLFELNEAFAAPSVAVNRELGVDPDKVNVCGGAIALGHPIGASGSRIFVTLVHSLKRLGLKKGVAALCVGGGMGVAVCVERK